MQLVETCRIRQVKPECRWRWYQNVVKGEIEDAVRRHVINRFIVLCGGMGFSSHEDVR
jgi:hypothetical protein